MAAVLDVTALVCPIREPERHELRLTSLWIGRDASNNIWINDMFISGFHVHLQKRGGIFYVHDLSRSGTLVNG